MLEKRVQAFGRVIAVQLAAHAGSSWDILIVLLCELSKIGLYLSF